MAFQPPVAEDHNTDLSGYWIWLTADDSERERPGILTFEQKADGRIIGYSVVEAPLVENRHNLRSSVQILPAEGSVVENPGGEMVISFTLKDSEGLGEAVSTATLAENGTLLKGKTVQTFRASLEPGYPTARVEYKWLARKFTEGRE